PCAQPMCLLSYLYGAAPAGLYTLSLHDALPISQRRSRAQPDRAGERRAETASDRGGVAQVRGREPLEPYERRRVPADEVFALLLRRDDAGRLRRVGLVTDVLDGAVELDDEQPAAVVPHPGEVGEEEPAPDLDRELRDRLRQTCREGRPSQPALRRRRREPGGDGEHGTGTRGTTRRSDRRELSEQPGAGRLLPRLRLRATVRRHPCQAPQRAVDHHQAAVGREV